MPDYEVTIIDLVIFFGYVIGTRILFGWYFARRSRQEGGASGYFLAGRKIRWPVIGLSFYVANMSGGSFVALPGSGYNDGVAVFNYEWLPAVILVLFAVFLLPLYLRAKVYTAPEYLERRFGRSSRLMLSGFQLTTSLLVDAAASLYAGGMIVRSLYPGIPLWMTVAVTSAVAGVYIAFGGLGAVVINDALQAILIVVGGTIVTILAFQAVPSWDAVQQSAPPEAMHLIRPADDPTAPWPGLITGVFIIGIYFWCTNQFLVQRALGAKSLDHGRWGALFAGALKLPNLFILVLPGVLATALYPDLENPDMVFPTLAFDMLPIGFRGLILASLAAAILSSLEAILNSASTLFTMDFVRIVRPQVNDKRLSQIGRFATLAFMAIAAAWTPQIQRFPTLWQYLQSVLSYVTPPVVAAFLFGIFWRRANAYAAATTLVAGTLVGIISWILIEINQLVALQYLYGSGILFVFSCLVMVVVSLLTASPPAERLEGSLWRPSLWKEESRELAEKPWYVNYRYLAIPLLMAIVGIVVWWW